MNKTIIALGKKGIDNDYVKKVYDIADYINNVDKNKFRNDESFNAVSERELVQYYVNLSQLNYSVDTNFYPLGSCTMKYNPKINEFVAGMSEFMSIHPLLDEDLVQGILQIGYTLQKYICEITKMTSVTLQPAAGAHGELTGLFMITKKLKTENKYDKNVILIPDSAHGTNPATAAFLGYKVVPVKTSIDGYIDLKDFQNKCKTSVAALMITIPNTLGIFENNIMKISEMIHSKGGYIYMDGANFNALVGNINPYSLGVDILHLNLHKTFSIPHGSGGPGSGVICVNEKFSDYMPVPIIGYKNNKYYLNYDIKNTIGKIKFFWGHTNHWIRALSYILKCGEDFKKVSCIANLNARFLYKRLSKMLQSEFKQIPLHEFVLSVKNLKKFSIRALDIAKRLIDYKIHPPTIYFPLIVEEALMIEPTETESRKTLEHFVEIMEKIIKEVQENSNNLHNAPSITQTKRVNEVFAARNLSIIE